MSKKCKYQITAGGVLLKQNQVLLLQRAASEKILPNLWELPSGKKEPSETILQALVREFKEETGLKVKALRPVSVFDYRFIKSGQMVYSTQINFLVKYSGQRLKIKLSPEHRAYKWVGRQDLKKLKVSKQIGKVLDWVSGIT